MMETAYAKCVGRVGALAVALGVSGAIATAPGVAWADETSSSASPGSSESGADATTSTPPSDQPSTTGSGSPSSGEPRATIDTQEAAGGDPDATGTTGSSSQTVTIGDGEVVVQTSGGALTSSDEADGDDLLPGDDDGNDAEVEPDVEEEPAAEDGDSGTTGVADENGPGSEAVVESTYEDTAAVGTPPTGSDDAEPPPRGDEAVVGLAFASATADPNRTVDQPFTETATAASIIPDVATLQTCACNVIKQVIDVVGNVIGPIFNPAGGPETPPSPMGWAVLGWVRRQLTAVLDSPPVAAFLQTVKTVGVRFYQALVTCGQPVQGLPVEFERTVLATGLSEPTDFRFLPDGRILITEKSGSIRVYENGQLSTQPLVTLPLGADVTSERGLSGIEVDPDFEHNGYIYVSYTSSENHLRLSRLTVEGGTAALSSEVVLVESDLEAGNLHHGGEIRFGPDDMLYWSVGENGFNLNAQDLSNIHGKVLRVNPHVLDADGTATIPDDNPFVDTPGARPEIYAYGFRNPFRFTFTPNDRLLLGDVGDQSWEELNIVTAGANYGWPGAEGICEGVCDSVNPVYVYAHTPPPSRAAALTSVLVYTGDTFGENYENKVFIADFTLGWIKVLTFDEQFTSVLAEETFDTQAGTPVKLAQGPDGNIYQLNIYPGELSVIAPSGGNRAPTAVITATPANGHPPLTIEFSSQGSTDPDPNTTLAYSWDFGDGASSTEVNPTHTYTENGSYDVTLTVSDGQETGKATQRIVVGSTAPTAAITSPLHNSLYAAGDTITFTGTGSDAEDGNVLPDSAYKWTIVFHHAEHIHPFADNIIGPSGSITIPRDPHNVANTWYEITLTVTDSSGLSTSQSVEVRPRIVMLTFNASDPDAVYTIDGIPHKGIYTEDAVVGVERVLSAPSPQSIGDRQLVFDSWSDGQAQTHVVRIPSTNTSYTATFVDVTAASLV